MTDVSIIVKTIIEHQQAVMGPLAIEQANKVSGLSVSDGGGINVQITNKNTATLLSDLVARYEELFGRASVEVCKDAVKEVTPKVDPAELPKILQ